MVTEVFGHELVSQDFILNELWDRGYVDVTKRTLRYWRAGNKLPPLIHHYTGEWVYPFAVMNDVIQLLHESNRKVSPRTVLDTITFENDEFHLYKFTVQRMTDGVIVAKYECEEGTFYKEMKEEDFNGKFTEF